MIRTPVFKPTFHVEVVAAEGVFFLSERDHFVLEGALYCALASLIDGHRTADQIVDELTGRASPAEVYYALARLEQKGYLVEAEAANPPERAAFWDALGLGSSLAEGRLRETTVHLDGFGAVPANRFAAALTAVGVQVREDDGLEAADFAVALTDDYLRAELAGVNAAALSTGRAWLLVKPLGTQIWIGPVFRPGQTGCWECLAQRLRANREVETYLQHRQRCEAPFALSRAALHATVEAALQLAAAETAKAIARGPHPETDATLLTLDLLSLETRRHVMVRRPQCARCGTPADDADQAPRPVKLQRQLKRFTADGGHRVVTPERTIARYAHHVSPITGAVPVLSRTTGADDGNVYVYTSGHNPAVSSAGLGTGGLDSLRRSLVADCSGKGSTDAQARASGLCEALERHAGTIQGGEVRLRATYRELGERAIHPNACMLFSEAQYRQRAAWNERHTRFQRVCDPFDEAAEIEWTPVWSLTRRGPRYLPTGYLYYGYRMPPGSQYCWTDSNGNAAGNTIEEAILQGFMELVERDSVAIWWYNRVRRPAIDLDSFDDRQIRELQHHYRQRNRDLWVLDLTGDLQIPTFAAISARTDRVPENIMLGFGAHFDPRIAISRALGELNQFAASSHLLDGDGMSGGEARLGPDDRDSVDWWRTATFADQPYLLPSAAPPRRRTDYETSWSDDLREDVLSCQAIVEQQGLELLVLDQTRPDIGLPVVKVIVPGLRHFWARLAPGRLYDVPVKLGWLDRPLSEDQLNPIPHFT